jgi:glycosyltransferase involved in cell wall biosynthesis
MRESPLVSILIPCHNGGPWIRESIESALTQTYANKEVIVVDDGSTDDSRSVIKSFGDRVIFQGVQQSGGNSARNRLTQMARGEWLQYLDADDYLLPGKIASQMATATSCEPNVDVIYSPVIIRDTVNARPDSVPKIHDDEDESVTFIRWGPLNTNGLLLRRKAVEDVGAWKEGQNCCQEHELLLRLFIAGHRFALHNSAETVYRLHSSQTVSRKDPLMVIRLRMELTDRMEAFLESTGRLTGRHRKALFVARMESARSAYNLDSRLATELSAKANARGPYWTSSSPALPPSYQAVCRIAGFIPAERIARWARYFRRDRHRSASDRWLL